MSLITGSIVIYKNDISILENAINSFLNTGLNVKLFLIDNSPSDILKSHFQKTNISYIHNPLNPGFGASHNIAIKKSISIGSDYHVVINPDIYYSAGNLEKMKLFMDSNDTIGQLMPKVLFPDGSFQFLCKRNPTVFDLFARGFMPAFLKNKFKNRLDKYEYRSSNFEKLIYDIPYLSGCFMFFRISVLKKVGLFDDKIFMYLEDADLTRRVLNVSRTVYYPDAYIFHHYAGMTHKKWKYKLITIKSAIIYFNKWGWFNSLF
jgi:GT2 family glycosyltransferase